MFCNNCLAKPMLEKEILLSKHNILSECVIRGEVFALKLANNQCTVMSRRVNYYYRTLFEMFYREFDALNCKL